MSADDVRRIVKSELDEGNLHVTSTKDFLERLLPVDADLIAKVYNVLVADRTYNAESTKWTTLAQAQGGKEEAIYAPFVETTEHIKVVAFELDTNMPPFRTKWVDRHNEAPSSIIPESATLRPDLINILQSDVDDIEAEVKKATTDEGEKEITKAWWHRVNSVTEVKTKKKVEEHVYQLLVYMRQMLAEQLDRRFVFGTLFCDSDLTIWLADRTGVLGTDTAINIHTEPKDFIRVILAMSLLPPEKLGWDTTMRICKQPIEATNIEAVHSFDPSVKLNDYNDYNDSASRTNWAIDMPAKDDLTRRETFITVRALDITRAASMSGRATIIWAVLKQADLSRPPSMRKIYVLKQTWRPLTATPEGEFYPKGGMDGHDLVYSYEDVKINGVTVDTFGLIRQSLESVTHPPAEETGKKRKIEGIPHLESLAKHLDIITTDSTQYMHAMHHNAPTFRVQSRMLMAFYGWPLRNFKDLFELLQVLKDAIEFHKRLYFVHLVLHRDISANNILIYPNEDRGKMEGRLIDYDYAKRAPDRRQSLLSRPADDEEPFEMFFVKPTRTVFELKFGSVPDDDSVFRALVNHGGKPKSLVQYLGQTWHIQQVKDKRALLTHFALGFLDRDAELPDFSKTQAQTARRSATFPYASAEVLQGSGMWGEVSPHDARHDMESFFWVLTEICISRSGPGGVRRKELNERFLPSSPNAALHRVYYCIFRSDDLSTLSRNKTDLFKYDDFEEFVLCHVHPYFERLKPLLLRWWRILMLVHRHTYIETVHDFFLDALNNTIQDLKKQPPELHPDTKEVVKQRQENLNMLRTLGSDDKVTSEVKWNSSPGAEIVPANTDYAGRILSKTFEEPESPTRGSKRVKMNH